MLNTEERSAGEHWKRAIRACSISFNQTRLAMLASFRDSYRWVRARVARVAISVWSFVVSLNIPSAKHIGFTIASLALISLIALGSITLSDAYNFSFVSQALFIIFTAVVISAISLGVMMLFIAAEIFRHQFLLEKRSPKKKTVSSFRKSLANIVAKAIKLLSPAGELAVKLALRIRGFGSYVLQSTLSSFQLTFKRRPTQKKRNSSFKKVSKQASAQERKEAGVGVSRDLSVEEFSGSDSDKSFSALCISILSRSANSVSVAVIEILSFTRNSFSFLSVGFLSVVWLTLTLGSSSWQISDIGKDKYPPRGPGPEDACDQYDWCEVSIEQYVTRFLSFTAPRRNFDVGPGSYISWSTGETDIKMPTLPTNAYCDSAVLIAVGMSSRSGSLHLNKDLAEERSFEAVLSAGPAVELCSSTQTRPRIVRVVLAERYLHVEDSSERVSLFLSSSVGDISYDRITAAIDAALEEDAGLTINPEESFIEVACPAEVDHRIKASWLLSDSLIAISDPWIRGCVLQRLKNVFSEDRSGASENT